MAKGNGKVDTNEVSDFPPVSPLGLYLTAVNDIRECVGTDHDAAPLALFCIVLREGGMDQFTLGADDHGVTLVGALEVAKAGLLDDILCGDG